MDMLNTVDAYTETKRQRMAFAKVRNAETAYGRQLRKVANHIADWIKGLNPDNARDIDTLTRMLEQYSNTIRPWAHAVARRMLADVKRRDTTAWETHTRMMGFALKREILDTPLGSTMAQLLDQQVMLITSLPLEAAKRVHELALGNLGTSERSTELMKQIMDTGLVTKSRATLIARTETARVATTLTMVRAKFIGSEGYIWRSVGDYKVRPELGIKNFAKLNTLAKGSHRKLNGTFHKWDDPPIVAPDGTRAHPGSFPNCRCWPEPVLPDQY